MIRTHAPSRIAKTLEKGRYIAFRLRQRPLMTVGMAIILCVVTAAVFAPLIAHYDPYAINLRARLQPPGSAHWFGTDEVGRDIFSRIVYGARQSVSIGIFVVLIAGGVGSTLGGLSAMIGGWTDTAIMRLMDVLLSFPSLVLIMALAAALGPSLLNAMLAIAIVRIPFYVRLARGQTLSLRSMDYVRAARTFGVGNWRILRWHIAPNALSPIIVQGTLDLGGAILMASALSFIGLGAQQPTAEWGAMVATGRNFILDQWWYSGFPGFAILITAMGFNLLGDGLRDILDPKQKERQ
ncbi:D,D-dipeptide ABC transporter permease [Varunaivibrio sulfuroxidans]|uniref:Peptide/nickel transport system permease protein n=1 Tax=Varunaivibrio sulfuroxidans TaxID=1773489 RepID=A0A4R3J9D7_9PROT|nr:D,D-dipeptide ABC transporter permease [Varunaivibrio sulfuroxidans]TCS62182.1 peptide/nickel transport system permease protein [Varunaivibrio sulfuroxidans]WES30609.1 D,D-dipeptide ABC transporter permease [Varunaivibrio sulfuroxidans]